MAESNTEPKKQCPARLVGLKGEMGQFNGMLVYPVKLPTGKAPKTSRVTVDNIPVMNGEAHCRLKD
jgi:hypothetical protein